jgi:adenylyltransferase/sulfurtransferase
MLLPGIGAEGQARLRAAHAAIIGCGALGSVIVDALARAGVGTLTIIDRDVVEITNLQRQILFDEHDVEQGMPKAVAAREKIERINRHVTVNALVDDFDASNAEASIAGADVLVDGLDNFETRYLVNDVAVKHGLPYVYGGAVGTTGASLAILPHPAARSGDGGVVRWTAEQSTPCLRCVFPDPPPAGSTPTCDTAGVLGPVVTTVAAHQATQTLKLLTGNLDAIDRMLLSIESWANEHRRFDVGGARGAESTCTCCAAGRFEYLDGGAGSRTTSLCGRNAVQISPPGAAASSGEPGMSLEDAAERLAAHGSFTHNPFLLRGVFDAERSPEGEPIELTLFPNGRAIIKGTGEADVARAIYAKYVGA